MIGIPGKLMNPDSFKLQGYSQIINSEGTVLSGLESTEGMIVSEIELKRSVRTCEIPDFDGWTNKGSKLLSKIITPIDIWKGKKLYNKKLNSLLQQEKTTADTLYK